MSQVKKNEFQTSKYIEAKLQPMINSSRLQTLGIRELDDIRTQIRSERVFLEEIDQKLEKQKAATAKRDKFHEKFVYDNLKVAGSLSEGSDFAVQEDSRDVVD